MSDARDCVPRVLPLQVTVVIPVLNEEKRIGRCLDALMQNTVLPLEVIVCDGGSSDGTVAIAQSRGAIVLHNPDRHAAAGRNLGISHARGEIVAFTDGDCCVAEDWVEQLCRVFAETGCDGLGGKVEPSPPGNDAEAFWGEFSLRILMSFPDRPYRVTSRSLNDAFITANCAYSAEALSRLGGFDAWFANNAEDVDLSWRALACGMRLEYAPSVKVLAGSPTTLAGIARKSFRNGVSSSKLQKRYGGRFNFDPLPYRLLARNVVGLFSRDKWAGLWLLELAGHLSGKYWGSLRYGVVNL